MSSFVTGFIEQSSRLSCWIATGLVAESRSYESRTVPPEFQLCTDISLTSQSTSGRPPEVSILLSLPSATNSRKRLSEDQTGTCAPAVPGSSCADAESRGRSHNEV